MYLQVVNSTVTKHSGYFVWKDMSEHVARRCDDTVDQMRVNLILVAFITGNSSLEPLIEGLYAQIHVNLR